VVRDSPVVVVLLLLPVAGPKKFVGTEVLVEAEDVAGSPLFSGTDSTLLVVLPLGLVVVNNSSPEEVVENSGLGVVENSGLGVVENSGLGMVENSGLGMVENSGLGMVENSGLGMVENSGLGMVENSGLGMVCEPPLPPPPPPPLLLSLQNPSAVQVDPIAQQYLEPGHS